MSQPHNRRRQFSLHRPARTRAVRARTALAALAALALAGLLGTLGGCREAFRSLGPDAAALRANSDHLFGALTARFTQVSRDAKYSAARDRLSRSALVPSKIFDDTSVWTGMPSPVVRQLMVQGSVDDGRYVLAARSALGPVVHPGDARHAMTLSRLSHNEFVWDTDVDFSLGAFPAAHIGTLVSGLIGSAEGRSEAEVRADYLAVAPRAAAVLGALFSIDTVRTAPFTDGSTSVTLYIGVHADELKKRYPAFGAYVAKYAGPARFHAALTDRGGASWFEVEGGERRLRVQFRAANGRLVPLHGPARERPDSMELRADFSTRFKLFTVGFRDLVSDFVITTTPHEQAWTIRYRREPHWDLPFITEKLLRTPLRRPFEGEGIIFHIGVTDSAGGPTMLERRSHTVVQESAILRFLNALGSGAMSELADRAEREEEEFLREIFAALQADARMLGPAQAAMAEEKTSAANP